MADNDLVLARIPDVESWRQHIHREPELGFKEYRTADFVAANLEAFGLEVHRDVSETAVVGVLKSGSAQRRIIFRAELDALPIKERAEVDYASQTDGVMHACGHDGHSAILLGAAELLSAHRPFDGEIAFLFQPAEEVLGGGRKLLEDGFLDRFPADAAFALHNWPGLAENHFAVRTGPMMAAVDDFTVTFSGKGCHAAMPDLGDDPILAATEFVQSAQRIVSRTIDPQSALVVSFTQIHGGTINNVVPGTVTVEGTCRFFDPDYSDHCATQLEQIARGISSAHGVDVELDYRKGYPAVINPASGARAAALAATDAAGKDRVQTEFAASMGCEDFAFLLNAVGDGAYVWLGAGPAAAGEGLHGDRYIFNDAIIPDALRFWINLAATVLPKNAAV